MDNPKKLNKIERETYAEAVMQKEKNNLISKADKDGSINKILLEAKRLERIADKAELKATVLKNNLLNYISENTVLIEGSYGSIVLTRDHDWNKHKQKYMYNTRINFDQSHDIKQKLEKAIVLAGIDAETREDLDEKVFQLMSKEVRLLID